MTGDELMAFISRDVDPPIYPSTCCHLLVSERASGTWTFPRLPRIEGWSTSRNGYGSERLVQVTDDGLLLYFHRSNISEAGTYVASRRSRVSMFAPATPVMIDGVPLPAAPTWLSPDGQTLSWWNGIFPGTVWAATQTRSFGQFSVSSVFASSDRWQEGVFTIRSLIARSAHPLLQGRSRDQGLCRRGLRILSRVPRRSVRAWRSADAYQQHTTREALVPDRRRVPALPRQRSPRRSRRLRYLGRPPAAVMSWPR